LYSGIESVVTCVSYVQSSDDDNQLGHTYVAITCP